MNATMEKRRPGTLVPASRVELVDRGPNWLFTRVETAGDPSGLAVRLWRLAEREFVYRLVVEFDALTRADPKLGMEMGSLCKRLCARGGALRLSGLSPETAHVVLVESGCPRLHNHVTPRDAVRCGPCCDG